MPSNYIRKTFGSLLIPLLIGCGGNPGAIGGISPTVRSGESFERIYQARADSALMTFTEADIDFVTGMIHHHAQALEMARMAPTHGASSVIQTLAARIINGQRDEIRTMQRWLADRDLPVPTPEALHQTGTMDHTVRDAPGHPEPASGASSHPGDPAAAAHADMPGMLTAEEMGRLQAARGPEFDRLFLALMIRHHRGAIDMVEELFDTPGAVRGDDLFKLASGIQAEQRSEIDRMNRMLVEMTGSPLGPALIDTR